LLNSANISKLLVTIILFIISTQFDFYFLTIIIILIFIIYIEEK